MECDQVKAQASEELILYIRLWDKLCSVDRIQLFRKACRVKERLRIFIEAFYMGVKPGLHQKLDASNIERLQYFSRRMQEYLPALST